MHDLVKKPHLSLSRILQMNLGFLGLQFSFGLQQIIPGYGRHEVVIDHTDHGIAIHEMSEEHLTQLFSVYRDRMRQLFVEFQMPHIKVRRRGTFSELMAVSPIFPSEVYQEYDGLDALPSNEAEGEVLQPIEPVLMHSGESVILKHKHPAHGEVTKPKSASISKTVVQRGTH